MFTNDDDDYTVCSYGDKMEHRVYFWSSEIKDFMRCPAKTGDEELLILIPSEICRRVHHKTRSVAPPMHARPPFTTSLHMHITVHQP
jgi:hypothetical protein